MNNFSYQLGPFYFMFVQLVLGTKTYKVKVSTDGCSDVADFRGAIKSKFSNLLDSYAPHHLTLFQPDGITEIDPETPVADLKEIPWSPLVVTVAELPTPAPIGSSKKQLFHKGIGVEASCQKYLDAIANELFLSYDFDTVYRKPTMGDLLAAKEGETWDYRKNRRGQQLTTTPLPSLFSQSEWDILKDLNADTTKRIYDAKLPQTSSRKPFVIIPHSKFTTENVESLKRIAVIADVVFEQDDLVVKDESDLSGS